MSINLSQISSNQKYSNKNNDSNILSPSNFCKLFKSQNLIKLEYLISTIISIYSLTYYSMNMGYISHNLIKAGKFEFDSLNKKNAYLSSYRDYSDPQWKFFREKYFSNMLLLIILIPFGRIIKTQSIDVYKIYMIIFGIFFSFYLFQLRFIYILLSSILFYNLKNVQNFEMRNQKLFLGINYITMIIIKCIFDYFKNNKDINELQFFKKFPKIDNISWNYIFVLSLLKMISYNIEYRNSSFDIYEINNNFIENNTKAREHCGKCAAGDFCSTCLENFKLDKNNDFSFTNYICYIFYPHLIFSGPIINYNSFIFQINLSTNESEFKVFTVPKILYLLKYILLFLVMEFYNHFIYSICIFKNIDSPIKYLSLFYYCFSIFHILIFIHIKWNIIWRTGRLLSLYDGIITEENCKNIFLNITNVGQFFREWNTSIYRWLQRYLYIPLEGNKKRFFNIFIIFCFVYVISDYNKWNYFVFFISSGIVINAEEFIKEKFIQIFGNDFNKYAFLRYLKYLINCMSIFALICICLVEYGINVNRILFEIKEYGGVFYFVKIILFILPIVIMNCFISDITKIKKNEYKRLYF